MVRVGEVGAPEDGFIRYYAGVQGGEVSVMGSVRVGEVGAPEDGFIRYYAGEGNGEVSVMGSVRVGGGLAQISVSKSFRDLRRFQDRNN